MNNRMAIGLAVGAGYVLGRTRKAKLAIALGTLVAGRRLTPDATAVASFLGSRLGDHPQFKEIGEQLREDLRGVGSAAVGVLVDRQLEAVADRLHERTLDVRDRLAGTGSDRSAEPARKPARKSAGKPAGRTGGTARTAGRSGGRKARGGDDG